MRSNEKNHSPEQVPLTVVPTSDGSNTLLHGNFRQTYHSVNGALQEARHVFLENGLLYFLQQHPARPVRILEIGFGAGLNFLVSAAHGLTTGLSLDYTGVEPFPVSRQLLEQSGYVQLLPGPHHQKAFLDWYPGECPLHLLAETEPQASIGLQLLRQPVLEISAFPPSDVVYFDAFAPATQPEMWTREVIAHTVSGLEAGGVFVSYSITGNLKRILKGLGFRIEKPKGAAGKREMIRATRQ